MTGLKWQALPAAQIVPGDILIRTSRVADLRYPIAAVRTEQHGSATRYAFIIAPHGDFIGWFSAGQLFTVERG